MQWKQVFFGAVAMAVGLTASHAAAEHPRLFVTEERLERIRAGLNAPDSHYARAFETLRERVASRDIERFGASDDNWNYARSYLAQAAAFCYQVSGDKQYARIAYQTLRDVHKDPDPERRLPESGAHGLSRATVGLGFALAYDWCHDAWDQEQRDYILRRVEAGLAMWEDFRHANFGGDRGSNWVAVCRGAELMMILAVGQEEQRAERYEMLQTELRQHIEGGYDSIGASQEGIGYVGYGGIFLLPAVYAARDVGDEKLWEAMDGQREWYRKAMYAGSFTALPADGRLSARKVFQMSGVGGPNINDEGWASLLLESVPEAELPRFLWWYDRHAGRLAEPQDQPAFHYEPRRQGTMWALLFYRDDVEAQDPTGAWGPLLTDGLGRHYFRNRWRDGSDVLVAIHADTRHHGNAWAQSEAGQMSLIAYDTMFFGGPRTGRDGETYTKLLVNGAAGESRDTGRRERFQEHERGGYVVIDGGQQYANLGVHNYQRHLLVDYGAPEQNNAVLAMLDRVDSLDEHTYTWNVNIGSDSSLGDWKIAGEVGEDQGYSTFTLAGRNGGVVKGWVLSPSDVKVDLEDGRLRVEKRTSSADFVVAISVEPESPARLELIDEGLHGVVFRIGQSTVAYDRIQGELLHGEPAEGLALAHDRPLPVRGLRSRPVADDSVELRWFAEERGADELLIEQRGEGQDEFEVVATLAPGRASERVTGLDPFSSPRASRPTSPATPRRSKSMSKPRGPSPLA